MSNTSKTSEPQKSVQNAVDSRAAYAHWSHRVNMEFHVKRHAIPPRWSVPTRSHRVNMEFYVKPVVSLLLLCLVGCSSAPFDLDCSVTCVANGTAVSATVCREGTIERPSCVAPKLIREPEEGDRVRVRARSHDRMSSVVEVERGSFAVHGAPDGAELGAGVWATSDGALVGVVEDVGVVGGDRIYCNTLVDYLR